MTKFILSVKSEREAEMLRAVLKYLGIEIEEEREAEPKAELSVEDFYNGFQFDMSSFQFDREEANAR
ncbi:MAG: hypothetical protein KDD02_06705 [Phaeodactylibacter sp.]|nr:hypothetical protein [Phaeodactylibacter sp.]